MLIQEALNLFYQESLLGITGVARAKPTIASYKSTWDLVLKSCKLQNCVDLTERVVYQFFCDGKQMRNWSASTFNTYRKNMAVFINWAIERQYLETNPLRNIRKAKTEHKLPRFYSESELQTILNAIHYGSRTYQERLRNNAMVAMAIFSGVRRGELLNQTLADIDFDNQLIHVQANTSKSKTERAVPIDSKLRAILMLYLYERHKITPNHNYLWVSTTTGNKFSEGGLLHLLKKLSKLAKFNIQMHSLRRSHGTYAASESHDIMAVKENLGHSQLKTTMLYVAALPDDRRRAAEITRLHHLFEHIA